MRVHDIATVLWIETKHKAFGYNGKPEFSVEVRPMAWRPEDNHPTNPAPQLQLYARGWVTDWRNSEGKLEIVLPDETRSNAPIASAAEIRALAHHMAKIDKAVAQSKDMREVVERFAKAVGARRVVTRADTRAGVTSYADMRWAVHTVEGGAKLAQSLVDDGLAMLDKAIPAAA